MNQTKYHNFGDFLPWPKTERLNKLFVTITEKIDGTNSCIIVDDDSNVFGTQSRKRLITPDDDNFGFSRWVYDNAEELGKLLGPGYHYGEWAGPGIQNNPLLLEEKTFFMFNVHRDDVPQWDTQLPITQVDVLHQGGFDHQVIDEAMHTLWDNRTSKGQKPEGIIIYFHNFRQSLKHTYENTLGKWTNDT